MGGQIPRTFIDDLLARTDIVELVQNRVPLKKSGSEFSACCPFHSEKTPSFTVSPKKQFYHCFGCGAHGNAISFLMDHDRLEFVEAIEELAHAAGLEVPREAVAQQPQAQTEIYEILSMADAWFRAQLRESPERDRAAAYLRARGLGSEVAVQFGIGLAPGKWDALRTHFNRLRISDKQLADAGLVKSADSGRCYDRFRARIMFPIRDRRGRTIAFGGRVFAEGEPKYLNSPETPIFHKGRELYGLYEARSSQRKLERLVVVEGYMDVVALAQHGISYAVATLGTATSQHHVESMLRVVPQIIFCFDGDRAGREAAHRALENTLPGLRDGREARFLFLPEGEDPDSLVRKEGQERFESRLDGAMPLSEFLLARLRKDLDCQTADGRARLIERARPLMQKLPPGAFWELLIVELSSLTKLPIETLRQQLRDQRQVAATPKRRNLPAHTPIRRAIALLLHDPTLAQTTDSLHLLEKLDEPGVPLLIELLEILQEEPHMTTGGILERFRMTPYENALNRLAQWTPESAEFRATEEFRDTLKRLQERHDPIRRLLDRVARGETLDIHERELLRNMGGGGAA